MEKETSISEPDQAVSDDIIRKGLNVTDMTREDIIQLLSADKCDAIKALYDAADKVRKHYVGNEIYLRGIVEFSNFCRQNCLYCGLRRDNRTITRYRLSEEDIITSVRNMKNLGIPTVVLQSGEDEWFRRETLCRVISRIKEETGLIITLSVGERSYDEYRTFRDAGADRYLLKHETASETLHNKLRPGASFENRLKCLHWLKELGYEVGTGMMIGLPDQDVNVIADDILLMREIDADMIGIGPFIAHPQTPLAGHPNGDPDMVLKVIAVTRIVTKNTNIPATTALGTLNPQKRKEAFAVGANVVMPDCTPSNVRQFYDIYPGKTSHTGDTLTYIKQFESEMKKIGRVIDKGAGYRKHD